MDSLEPGRTRSRESAPITNPENVLLKSDKSLDMRKKNSILFRNTTSPVLFYRAVVKIFFSHFGIRNISYFSCFKYMSKLTLSAL
jgi:hypothetical protein